MIKDSTVEKGRLWGGEERGVEKVGEGQHLQVWGELLIILVILVIVYIIVYDPDHRWSLCSYWSLIVVIDDNGWSVTWRRRPAGWKGRDLRRLAWSKSPSASAWSISISISVINQHQHRCDQSASASAWSISIDGDYQHQWRWSASASIVYVTVSQQNKTWLEKLRRYAPTKGNLSQGFPL